MPPSRVTYVLARPAAGAAGSAASYSGPTAAQQAQAVLGPQLAQQDLYATHQNAVIQSFARSLLGKLQPVAGQVGGDYNQAIKQIGGLSGQAAQYLSGQNPSAVQQALQASVGAPPEQQAQAAQALGNVFQGGAGVLAFRGGTIPGSELAGNKAAAMAQARQLPGIAALKGQQDLASALWKQSQDRATLEATRPQLVQQAQQGIDTANYRAATLGQAQQRLDETQREFGITRADKAAATKAATDYKYTALATTSDYKNRALAATNAYRQSQIDQSQQRVDLGYTRVAQTAKDKAADRAATKTYHDSYLAHLTAGDSERVAHDKALEAATTERNAISQQQADTSAKNATTSRINARTSRIRATATKAPKLSTSASGRYGYQYDTSGNLILRNGQKVPYPKTTTGAIGADSPSTGRKRKLVDGIDGGLQNALNGFDAKDIKGKVVHHPALDRAGAMRELELHGYFATPALKKLAMSRLNKFYPPLKTVRSSGPLGVTATG